MKNQLCVMNKAQKQAEERNVAKGALLQVGPVSGPVERFFLFFGNLVGRYGSLEQYFLLEALYMVLYNVKVLTLLFWL